MQNNLGIAVCAEAMTERLQFGAGLQVVVDLTVVDEYMLRILGYERLVTGLAEVQDRQSSVAEATLHLPQTAEPGPSVVWPAVRLLATHSLEATHQALVVAANNDTRDAAHGSA
jgi:hypothetical protein